MEKLSDFNKEYDLERPEISFERGIIDVPIADITGTVGRYRDFETSNLLNSEEWSQRAASLEKLADSKETPEPIELYKLKNKYFILDGHHRYLLAQKMGLETIRARVIEYLPPRNSFENILAWERSRFERMTGVTQIILTELSQYDKLLDQIREHKHYKSEELKEEMSFDNAAKDWYENVFVPISEKIANEQLLSEFPNRTAADLYTYASEYKWFESQKRGYDIGFDAAIAELHKKEHHTLLELLMMRLLMRKTPHRNEFIEKTGLKSIFLSKDQSYSMLIKQIEEHKYFLSQKRGSEVPIQEAAHDWYYDVYRPITILISKEPQPIAFASKTPGDLYVMLSEEKWLESEKMGYDIGFQQAVKTLIQKKKPASLLRSLIAKIMKKLHLNI